MKMSGGGLQTGAFYYSKCSTNFVMPKTNTKVARINLDYLIFRVPILNHERII